MSQPCSQCQGKGSIPKHEKPAGFSDDHSLGPVVMKCPICHGTGKGKGFDIGDSSRAGEQLGELVGAVVHWALNNRYLAFVWFYIGIGLTGLLIGQVIWGSIDEMPVWYRLSISYLPVIPMIVYRKNMIPLGKTALKAAIVSGLILIVLN